MTRLELIKALETTVAGDGTISDDHPVNAIVYNSKDGGMTMVDYDRNEYDELEFIMAEPFVMQDGTPSIQLVFQLKS
jgi:hypothetical protein